MQIGLITVGGIPVGVVNLTTGDDSFVPDLAGYEPQGRAAGRSFEGQHQYHSPHHVPSEPRHHHWPGHHPSSDRGHPAYHPRGEIHAPSSRGTPFSQGSAETDQAIVEAARAHHLDPNFMRSIASIESSMNPASNANNRATQYKGLYQIGRDEWRRTGAGGNIYSARDNAMAAGRLFSENRRQFHERFGRDPTDTEMYLMHQQGLGFYTRGAMTNIGGNPYPGMHGAQNHESFEAGWGREVARRKAAFASREARADPPKSMVFDPETMAP